jgi:hypothetical protein
VTPFHTLLQIVLADSAGDARRLANGRDYEKNHEHGNYDCDGDTQAAYADQAGTQPILPALKIRSLSIVMPVENIEGLFDFGIHSLELRYEDIKIIVRASYDFCVFID